MEGKNFVFFFQAEDGIRDYKVTGVQTCALPIFAGFAALDRHTVQVTLTEALVPFVAVLAVGHAKIVPREVVEEKGDAFGTAPVGTGPFRFMKWERGRELVLAANPDYFEGAPRLAQLVYRVFPGEQFDTMYEEFQRGHLEDTPPPHRDYRKAI